VLAAPLPYLLKLFNWQLYDLHRLASFLFQALPDLDTFTATGIFDLKNWMESPLLLQA
jgi:hypothetical protein